MRQMQVDAAMVRSSQVGQLPPANLDDVHGPDGKSSSYQRPRCIPAIRRRSAAMLPRLTFLVLALLLGTTSSEGREEQDPLQIVTPSEWRDMTEGERHRYVLGVLEGWSFNLYAKGDLDLGPLVECVTREGVPKITLAAQNALLLGEAASPAPWWIARAMGTVCTKYRY